ncbi:MAG: uracil-DNA glycosylase [Spirochaetaceae bacterium]|jgi:DNA polymerase|nr:uracil-DNA glycosylase [Spirochaetaceae bacterium]
MTAEEKNKAALFLDLADDYLLDGYRRPRTRAVFEDSAAFPAPEKAAEPLAGNSRETPRGTGGQTQTQPAVAREERDGEASPGAGGDSLEKVAEEVRRCDACRLCETRTQGVPGEGAASPLVLVVGEAPGADEDASGRPFVGKAGQLLDRMLDSIGLSRRKNCFIANVVKCRPPQNRDPMPDELVFCSRFLKRQIEMLKPKVILCAGRISAQTMLRTTTGIGKLRGRFEPYPTEDSFDESGGSTPLLPTYHPSALLRDGSYKRPAWEDLKTLRAKLAELDDNYARETAGQ